MSEIEWRRLRNRTAREIVSALNRDGFGRQVTVTFHRAGDTFPIGTLRSMIEIQARWSENDLRRLSLL
jgi:predicted RNA binding protein YcfA (HicA-like mRNA interferase family)